MRSKVIEADTIDKAIEEILRELKEGPITSGSISSRKNVIYFNGWDGLGASTVLRAIARRLTFTSSQTKSSATANGSSVLTGLEFEQVMHIDCSKWRSRRALQRAIAEQLELPAQVLELFDRQDEEDDYRGVVEGSRAELGQVTRLMYQHMQKLNRRFLVIFHNGSNEEIDLDSCCGLPLSGYTTNKVLWTFQGRFRLMPEAKVDSVMESAGTTTDVFLSTESYEEDLKKDLWAYLVNEEAQELTATHKINTGPAPACCIIHQPAQVAECFLYMLDLCWRGRHSIDYNLATHIANYWICDGVMKKHLELGERDDCGADDELWRASEALQCEMQLDVEYQQYLLEPSHLERCAERRAYWTSPAHGFLLIPAGIISNRDMLFLDHSADKLSVLKLSNCSFNFPSVPFLSCHNLRFLWLDHCRVITSNGVGEEEEEEDDISQCFERLWVLVVRYTKECEQILSAQVLNVMIQLRELNVEGAEKWDMGQMHGRLPNIRKLRVTRSGVHCISCSENDLFSKMNRMELLDFSSNKVMYPMKMLCGPCVDKSSNSLETVVIAGNSGLKEISFRGCAKLKQILSSGALYVLDVLDISGTSVKTLDLIAIWELKELYLLACENLCSIRWSPLMSKNMLNKVHIETTRGSTSGSTVSSLSSPAVLHGNQPANEFDWYISVRDARLLQSLEPAYPNHKIYVEISSSTGAYGGASKNERTTSTDPPRQQESVILRRRLQQHTTPALLYAGIGVDRRLMEANGDEGEGDAPNKQLPKESCYLYIQDQGGSEHSDTIITVPPFVGSYAKILHVHDSLSITILPSCAQRGSEWNLYLEWFRVERCPKLECFFAPEDSESYFGYYELRIFWASQLPKARYIWQRSKEDVHVGRTFPKLTCLHLDYCPKLIHVVPMGRNVFDLPGAYGFPCLETLEIMWCGDLREVFPFYGSAKGDKQERQPLLIDFPMMKRIHLHELPKLCGITGPGVKMSTPKLETVKIRGCWSLKRLPMTIEKVVQCDCEKDWWDSLDWEEEDASQMQLYRPIHSKYYKKARLLRGTVLR